MKPAGGDNTSVLLSAKKNTSEKSTILNIDAVEQSLWLVKVPQFVAERWATAENDDILGSLSVSLKSTGPNKPPGKQLNVSLASSDKAGPSSFTLDELKSSTDNFIAISSDEKKGYSIDGKVTKNMVLKPQINDEYRQLIRNRGLNTVANRKEICIANMQEIERTSTQSHTVEFITSDRMEMKRKAAAERSQLANKMSRIAFGSNISTGTEDGDMLAALRSKVFEAFEKTDRLTFKDVLSFCSDVPGFSKEKDLRDILDLYGRYNHRGTFKHFWELKAEYKDNYTENTSEKTDK